MAGEMTFAQAQGVLQAAIDKSNELGLAMNIAVVDEGNNLTAFGRMDGAWLGSISIAQDKAYTARAFDMPTADLATMSQSEGALFGIHTTNDNRIVIFAGGVPLQEGDRVVGAVGVSGGTPDQDNEVAQAGAQAFTGGARV